MSDPSTPGQPAPGQPGNPATPAQAGSRPPSGVRVRLAGLIIEARTALAVPDAGYHGWAARAGQLEALLDLLAEAAADVIAEPMTAGQILAGDRRLLDDGQVAAVTRVRHGHFWIGGKHQPGMAIDWTAGHGSARGTMFRRGDEALRRLPGGAPRGPATGGTQSDV